MTTLVLNAKATLSAMELARFVFLAVFSPLSTEFIEKLTLEIELDEDAVKEAKDISNIDAEFALVQAGLRNLKSHP